MGTITHIDDFKAAQQARTAAATPPRAADDRWAEGIAAWWHSPAGRVVAAAGVFAVLATGLVIFVVGMAAMLGRF